MARTPVTSLSIGAGAALLVLGIFGAVAFASVSRLAKEQAAVVEANTAIAKLDQLLAASSEAERAGTEFMMSGAQDALTAFGEAREHIEDALDDVRVRAEDRPREKSILDTLGPVVGDRIATISAGIAARRRDGAAAALALSKSDTTRATRGGILPLVQRLRDEELVLLAEKTRLMSRNGRISKMVILGGSILAFVLAAVALTPHKQQA